MEPTIFSHVIAELIFDWPLHNLTHRLDKLFKFFQKPVKTSQNLYRECDFIPRIWWIFTFSL